MSAEELPKRKPSEIAAEIAAFSLPGGESTSAMPRRVERERDELAAQLATTERTRDRISETAAAAQRALMARNAELKELRTQLAAVREAAGRDIADPPEVNLRNRVAELRRGRTEATQRALELAAELASARTELERLRKGPAEADLVTVCLGQLIGDDLAIRINTMRDAYAAALAELEQLRFKGWIVARDDSLTCVSCRGAIRRGEAYSTNSTADEQCHIYCRTEGES